MHKRKYTREQLEFYFKKLMEKLNRIPREEDMEKASGYPSVTVYVERFGSWQKAVELFANFELAKVNCKNCKKVFIKSNKNQKFCSQKCLREGSGKKNIYNKSIEKKIFNILNNECFVCGFNKILEVHILDNKKESNNKILKHFSKKDLHNLVLLCPNHHLMIHKKLAKLYYSSEQLYWEEI